MTRILLIPIIVLALATSARAHHGLDFLLLQDATFPQPLSGSFFNNSEWTRERALDEYATEPGLHLGVLPGLAVGGMAHFADMGDGWAYSSTTPYVVINLLPVEIKGVRVALWTGYEFASEEETHSATRPSKTKTRTTSRKTSTKAVTTPAAAAIASSTSSSTKGKSAPSASRSRHTGGTTGGGGPDAPTTGTHDHPVAAPAAAAPAPRQDDEAQQVVVEPVIIPIAEPVHIHEGIHRHGQSGLHSRLIIEADLGKHDKIVANLINFTPEHGKGAWGYGVGLRHAFHHDFAMSVEAVGDFDASLEHQALVAAHWSPVDWLALKVGVGIGITPEASDVAVHTGIVWRF